MTSANDSLPATAVSRPSRAVARWHRPVFICFLLAWTVNMVVLWLGIDLSRGGRWLEGLFLAAAVTTTLIALGRRLPVQNVATTAGLVLFISAIIVSLGALSGVPFGARIYSELLGDQIFNVLPWSLPLVWILVIVNGRGIARLMMRPWRKTNYYGFWVIGLTCLLAVVFDLGLEPFAVRVKNYWIWNTPASVPAWYTAPWVNSLGWFVTALAVLAFTIPWLINKQPIKQPIDYHPLITWLLLNVWFMTGNALHHLWPAVAVGFAGNFAIATFAIRGARW